MRILNRLARANALARAGGVRDGLAWLVAASSGERRRIHLRPYRRDILVRTHTPDVQVMIRCFGGEFDELLEAVPRLSYPLVIDAGGYIGTAAIVFAEAYGDATVVTLEPSRENFALLSANVAAYPNIVPMRKALAATPGTLTLFDRGTGAWGFTTVAPPANCPPGAEIERVDCVTLEQLMSEFGVDGIGILKLDIEGAEHALFSAEASWIGVTQAICIELHDRIVPGCSELWRRRTRGRRNGKLPGEKYLSLGH